MPILSFFKIDYIIYAAAAAAIGFGVYTFHYKPINNLKKEVLVCCDAKKVKQDKIEGLELEKHNLEQLLQQAQADIETEMINIELCELKSEAYQEDNTTVKDTTDEGYLVF